MDSEGNKNNYMYILKHFFNLKDAVEYLNKYNINKQDIIKLMTKGPNDSVYLIYTKN